MFEFWNGAAARFAPGFRLSKDLGIRAHALVRSKLGDEWVEANCVRHRAAPSRSISDIHPLTLALKGATEECVLDVLRIAGYLCAFRDDPGLDEVIASLRDADKYHPTIFELAVAWSFKKAGASVTLFPRTPKGAADFAAAIGGREYIVEASGFPSDTLRDDAMSFLVAMNGALNSAASKLHVSFPLVLEIDLDDLDQRDRTAAHAAVKDVVRAFVEGGNQRATRRFEFGSMAVRTAAQGETPDLHRWTNATRTNQGHLTCLRDWSEGANPSQRLNKKLKREASQLSGCADGIVILDIEALGVDTINNHEGLKELASHFARSHRSTTGVAFTVLAYHQNGHRGLSGHYFPLAPSALPETFFQRVLDSTEGEGLFDELRVLDGGGQQRV